MTSGRRQDPRGERNDAYADLWSITHVLWGLLLGLLLHPFLALVILVLWEPFEVLIISPLAARFGVEFGHEGVRNSLMDILFDALGVALAVWFLVPLTT